jgi:hypothetical protein
VKGLAGIVLSVALAAQVALPPAASEVKVLRGRIVTAESAEKGGWVIVRDLSGRVLRKVQAGAGVEGVRAAEIKDFTLDAERTLVVSLGVAYALGRSARMLAFYPEKGQPRFVGMDDVVCLKLAADEATGVWCLGPGLEDTLLHRVSGPAAGPWSLLARKRVRLLANAGGETRQAFDAGQMGVPAMMTAGPGRLVAYLPNTLAVHEVDARTGEHMVMELPLEPRGRSNVTVAAGGGVVMGLMPVLRAGEMEQFTTRYGMYRWEGRWVRVVKGRDWPRGSVLAGIDGGVAYVWNRTESRVESAELR